MNGAKMMLNMNLVILNRAAIDVFVRASRSDKRVCVGLRESAVNCS